ncbi:hypothetical protein LMB39_04630 [Limosilactobacillus reuteri]|uniref:hypothetical protein n=1 Tax=Limosilactobacillus reuteri TaxID=1598 RepID=UPI00129B6D70|nr:hypothetical protein [Limosilactobacillus reuteri]MCC4342813.1 hypothetical protein [Limosilactobacillus reuteri]MCC4348409.1 hypothetical protein [Limosilactobacillus reuteri]MCC4375251.1 hypothetical protein [Limosilactobacillus reuteri]MCC4385204.1 hypothetical protein [Limosilactobacillus reuteri]MRI08088.1 hypothetical protein [Limosilactobacillus reuteri]
MLHKYRKTALIEAEQFDGTVDMMREYSIVANPDALHDPEAPLYTMNTKEGEMIVYKGDWIATGIDGEHWAIAPEIFEKTYERYD